MNEEQESPESGPKNDAVARREYGVLATAVIAVAAGVALARIASAPPLQSANDRSRWATVYSLVHHGTYAIDRIDANARWQTIDKVRSDGHFYSSKPPLLATVVAGVYAAGRAVFEWDLGDDTESVTRWLLLIVNWISAVISWAAAAWALPKLIGDRVASLVVLLAAGTATLPNVFLATLNNHTVGLAGFWLMLAACVAFETTGRKWLSAAAAGFFAAWAICNELPAFPLGAVLFVWFWRRDAKRAWLAFAPAAAVPIVAFFVTNWLATGGWKPFYLSYGTVTYEYVHRGVPSYWMNPSGIDANRDSTPVYILHTLIGHHGVLSLTPFFLLTAWAFGMRLPGGGSLRSLSAWRWVTVAMTAWTLLFFWSKTENYNYGGSSCGLRWVFWLVPFWCVLAGPAIGRLLRTRAGGAGLAVMIGASAFFANEPWARPWSQPWLYRQMTDLGWIDYSTPVPPLPRRTHTWLHLLPSGPLDEDYRVTFYVDGLRPRLVTLSDGGLADDGRRVVVLEDGDETTRYVIEPKPFAEGRPVEDWADEGVAGLRGLPSPREYRAGRPDYLFTPVDDDALTTQKLAARVLDRRRRAWVRRDVWWTDAVPFGVAQMVVTVSSGDGSVLARETWRLARVGRMLSE